MTDEPAQSSTPIRLPAPAAAQDIAAEPARSNASEEERKRASIAEEEQPEEKMKTDTQMR